MILLVAAALMAPTSVEASDCVRLARPVARGGELVAADFRNSADCPERPGASALQFNVRTGAVSARRDLAAGEIITAPPGNLIPAVRRGDALFLRSHVGAIAVERPVTALQAGRSGRKIFAITADGEVVSVLVGEVSP